MATHGQRQSRVIASPLSNAHIKRIPSKKDLLLIWNDHTNIDESYRSNALIDLYAGGSTTLPAALLDLLTGERGKLTIVASSQSNANPRDLLTHPLSSIITDGFYVAERPHPGLAGAFPTSLGEFTAPRVDGHGWRGPGGGWLAGDLANGCGEREVFALAFVKIWT